MKIVSWSGCKATDSEGKEYVDLTSGGIFAAGFGPADRAILEAIKRVSHFCSYSYRYGNSWRDRYVEELKDFTGFDSVALFSTGSEAVEAWWRVCRVYTGKPGVWGGLVDPDEVGTDKPMADQFHGWTLGSMICAGKVGWWELGITPELGERRFGQGGNLTAGMIMEPYHAASGQFHRVEPTIKRIAGLKRVYPDIPLCIDEIQGGFGRTGKLWAHEHYPEGLLYPDFVTIGKLCGGGLPLAALLGPGEIMESDAVQEHGHLHSTHSGNPVMCSVGCAVIERFREENLIEESARKGGILHGELSKIPIVSHGKGLLAGLAFRDREECARAVEMCRERGLLVVDTGRKWIKLGPALTIDEETLLRGIGILRGVVEEIVYERNTQTLRGTGEEPGGVGADLPGTGVSSGQPGEIGSPEDGG